MVIRKRKLKAKIRRLISAQLKVQFRFRGEVCDIHFQRPKPLYKIEFCYSSILSVLYRTKVYIF